MFDFKITPVGEDQEPFTVSCTSRDIYVWEKSGRGRTVAHFSTGGSMEAFYQLAYITCRRTKKFEGTQAEFVDQVDLELDGDDKDDKAALVEELTTWRDLAAGGYVSLDEVVSQLDERIAELTSEKSEDPTRAGASPAN
jgi:hypothetical protein